MVHLIIRLFLLLNFFHTTSLAQSPVDLPIHSSSSDKNAIQILESSESIFSYSGVIGTNAWELRLTCPITDIIGQLAIHEHASTVYVDPAQRIPDNTGSIMVLPTSAPSASSREMGGGDVLAFLIRQSLEQARSSAARDSEHPNPGSMSISSTNHALIAHHDKPAHAFPASPTLPSNIPQSPASDAMNFSNFYFSDMCINRGYADTCFTLANEESRNRKSPVQPPVLVGQQFWTIFVISLVINAVVIMYLIRVCGRRILRSVTPCTATASPPEIPELIDLASPAELAEATIISENAGVVATTEPCRVLSIFSPPVSPSVSRPRHISFDKCDTHPSGPSLLDISARSTNKSSIVLSLSPPSSVFDPQSRSPSSIPVARLALPPLRLPPGPVPDVSADLTLVSLSQRASMTFLFCDGRYESEFQQMCVLGTGGFGDVYKCKNKLTNVQYAIKRVPVNIERIRPSEARILDSYALREVTISAVLNHMHVVRYITAWLQDLSSTSDPPVGCNDCGASGLSEGSTTSDDNSGSTDWEMSQTADSRKQGSKSSRTYLFIQMELCDGGTLRDILADPDRSLSLGQSLELMSQLLSAVEYIHKAGFIHRDIKPSNIFIHDDTIKIGDFGCSRTHMKVEAVVGDRSMPQVESIHNLLEMLQESEKDATAVSLTTGVGTSVYAAPEQLSGSRYDSSSDIYSLGIVFFEMLHPHFRTGSERAHVLTALRVGRVAIDVSKMYPTQAILIERMVNTQARQRPTLSEIIKTVDSWKRDLLRRAVDIARKSVTEGPKKAVMATTPSTE